MTQVIQGDNAFIYQIYYDEESRKQLDPGFIPLDNSANPRPDWYEFWVILNHLKTNTLRDDAWYGFLSPRFPAKTGIDASTLLMILGQSDPSAAVALFHAEWAQLAYFRNPFEQGDFWHPGLSLLSQSFFDAVDLPVDTRELVTSTRNAVFSNFIVAKPAFWQRWLEVASRFFEFVEGAQGEQHRGNTSYFRTQVAPMKTFVQERLATVVLACHAFEVVVPDVSPFSPIPWPCADVDGTRRILQACDLMKQRYCTSGDPAYLDMYDRLRAEIEISPP